MPDRDWSLDYPDDPEQGMRAALSYTVASADRPAKHLAADLDESPSDFSRMTSLTPSDESNHRRNIPLGKLVRLIRATPNHSILATLMSYCGYDSSKLVEIRKRTKSALQVEEEKVERLKAIQEDLKLLMQEVGGKVRKK